MTKKSAASAKIKAVQPPELTEEEKIEKLRKEFDENKNAFLKTVETQIAIAERYDNFTNLWELAERVLDEKIEPSLAKDLVEESKNSYQLVHECVQKFAFDDFMGDDLPDYFEDIKPKYEDCGDRLDHLYNIIRYMSVMPYGDKMLQMYQTIKLDKTGLGL